MLSEVQIIKTFLPDLPAQMMQPHVFSSENVPSSWEWHRSMQPQNQSQEYEDLPHDDDLELFVPARPSTQHHF